MEEKVHFSSDMVKSFDGEGDLMAWLTKVKLVTRLQKMDDFASFIPLFLGDTLVLYLQLSEDQLDADKIVAKLKRRCQSGQVFLSSFCYTG